MEIRIQYLAALREIAGKSEELIDLSAGARVRDLLVAIVERYGKAASDYLLTADGGLRPGFIVLVNGKATDLDRELEPGSVVQILPPVGGGRGG